MRARIVAAYAVSGSKAGVAREFDVSEASVRRILREASATAFDDIKKEVVEEAARSFVAETQGQAAAIVKKGLELLMGGGKLEDAGAREIATVMGILIDKYALTAGALDGGSDTGGGVVLMPTVLDDPDKDQPMIEEVSER